MKTPQYNRSFVKPGIVHIGLGNFQRSHQAVYTEKVLEKSEGSDWGICGVGIMPWDSEIRDALKSQDNLYTLVTQTGDRVEAQIVGSIVEYIYGVDNAQAVVDQLAAPTTRIVSLTVTEKGYSQDQVTGDLDLTNDGVMHDLKNIEAPQTAIGYIVSGLNRRFQDDGKSFTVMSCDNLQGNGDMTKKLVMQFATELNPELAIWIQKNTAFPNSMVDRITPRTTQELKESIKELYGVADLFPVKSEEFIQWVIEDQFSDGRPDWEGLYDATDFMFVEDVHPFEMMKQTSQRRTRCLGLLLPPHRAQASRARHG